VDVIRGLIEFGQKSKRVRLESKPTSRKTEGGTPHHKKQHFNESFLLRHNKMNNLIKVKVKS
jgi:hypothetical protein